MNLDKSRGWLTPSLRVGEGSSVRTQEGQLGMKTRKETDVVTAHNTITWAAMAGGS